MTRIFVVLCIVSLAVLPVIFSACTDTEVESPTGNNVLAPALDDSPMDGTPIGGISDTKPGRPDPIGGNRTARYMQKMLNNINNSLEQAGSPYRGGKIEWLVPTGAGDDLNLVYFEDRGNRRLDFDFVPHDPRRYGPGAGDEITYVVDQSDGNTLSGLTNAATEAAIDRAMTTWNNEGCLNTIVKVADPGFDPDVADGLYGFPGAGVGTPVAQLTHAGWVRPGLPTGILGFTITFGFVGPNGFTDINEDDLYDCAFREIYYHNVHFWRINSNIDVESVALHEAGHGLSQAHFGKLFQSLDNGKFHWAPLAVMNAGYTGVLQTLQSTDHAGHCTIWSSWPNN